MRISDWSSDVCSSDLTDGVILAARPEVGELLRFHRVDFKVVGLRIFADDHAFIDRLARRVEQDAAIFNGIKGIAHRFARPVGDKDTVPAAPDIALVRALFLAQPVHYAGAERIGRAPTMTADNATGKGTR